MPVAGQGATGRTRELPEAEPAPPSIEIIEEPSAKDDSELQVEVHSPRSEALENVMVALLSKKKREFGRTDKMGLLSFKALPAARYLLRFYPSGLPPLQSAKPIEIFPKDRVQVRYVLGPFSESISGRVLDWEGNCTPEASLLLQKKFLNPNSGCLVYAPAGSLEIRSEAGGWYGFINLEPGDYLVTASAAGSYLTAQLSVRSGTNSADLVLEKPLRAMISGRAIERDGTPLPGIKISLLPSRQELAISDEEGNYRSEVPVSPKQDHVVLHTLHAGYREALGRVALTGWSPGESLSCDLVLEPLGKTTSLSGWVADSTGAPIGGEEVHLYSASLQANYSATTDGDGFFEIKDIGMAKDYRLWVHPLANYKNYTLGPFEVGEEGLAIEIALEPLVTGNFLALLTDTEGVPIPHLTLWVQNRKALGQSRELRSDERGGLDAEGVPCGKLVLKTISPPLFIIEGLELRPSDPRIHRLVLNQGRRRLTGAVLDPWGNPVSGARVELRWSLELEEAVASSLRRAESDKDGRFVFSQLGAGLHELRVTARDRRECFSSLLIDDSRPSDIVVELKEKS